MSLGQLVHLWHLYGNEQPLFKNAGYSSTPFSASVYFPVASEIERTTLQYFRLRKETVKLLVWNNTLADEANMEFREVLLSG